ncbi:BgTH12-03891 [Blumeria graminis f. sp. triticale]|uniref:Bgt-4184 n=3 Tax=Blumeria graminis TaxID=34373 RepID=A0A061HMR3_BLUGR|nr:Component of the Paf1p complex [Blumeria graminis f. sp. tritici 96224]CAD6499784.1 BgTH12-03891 [Blumeria graminis f. sp. triticale]VCU39947.1 Bgt-4184 [Blumeria graminis f. sp. tritici]
MTSVNNGQQLKFEANRNGSVPKPKVISKRFSDIPSAIDIPVQGEDDDQAVEVDLEDLLDDPTELCTLLENEGAARTYWMTVSLAYAKQKKVDHAIEILLKGGQTSLGGNKDKLSMLTCLCWMYLWKSREAPRVAPEDSTANSSVKNKEFYLQLSTSTLNEASRIDAAFPPLFLARGVLLLLKASLQPPSKPAANGTVPTDKVEILRASLKSFEDSIRASQGKNMVALMGKARALYSLGKFADSLEAYQEVLQRMPDFIDPDPRIGIGCCFWQLDFKEDAKIAWERVLEINPDSKIANILLGLFYLDASAHVPINSAEFVRLYKKAMTEYTQKAFKKDKNLPLTCATFAGYFLSRKSLSNVETLAHKAIQNTDVNAIASDGWYLLARKEHYSKVLDKATDYYRRADEARGGTDRGYLPAKFGAAQLSVSKGDLGEAKLRLEKIIQQTKNIEAMILLGTIYAEEAFKGPKPNSKDDKSSEFKKATGYLESVRSAWKDPKKNLIPNTSVLLNLARLYETDQPEKSLQCLQQVEQIEYDQVPEEERPKNPDEEVTFRINLRENLPPQLLNNMGCFYYQSDKKELARDMFQSALNACVKAEEKRDDIDTDALVTTISYNLGRTLETMNQLDEAKAVFQGLLRRHGDYTDARTRMAYIALCQNPTSEGPKAVASLYQSSSADLEVRALYGWYLGKLHSRKRNSNITEDSELRHYKHTLQNYDKHDRYALIGMGNIYLAAAREMRRETDQEKQKRSSLYTKAVEFFDKALQLDPKNAYAAQGIAIALVEDKKDFKTALGIFIKVRETVKDPNIYINLGHIFAELKQWNKAIEHYEIAMHKERSRDPQVLACLGRTWLSRARAEKMSLSGLKSALEYSQKSLEVAPNQIHFKFNVAFIQMAIGTAVHGLKEGQRTLAQVEEAAAGVEEAIKNLDEIANHPQTPYPKHDIEQRANMGRNTVRNQLSRALQNQREYEEKNAEKLQAAKQARDDELRKRELQKLAIQKAEQERKLKIAKERHEIAERDRQLAEARAEEERNREAAELTTDSETGERIKRRKKPRAGGMGGKRKKKNDHGASNEEESGAEPPRRPRKTGKLAASGADSEDDKPKKKRRLANKKIAEKSGKFKSNEIVVESESEEEIRATDFDKETDGVSGQTPTPTNMEIDEGVSDEDEDSLTVATQRKNRRTARFLDSDDAESEVDGNEAAPPLTGASDEDDD